MTEKHNKSKKQNAKHASALPYCQSENQSRWNTKLIIHTHENALGAVYIDYNV